MALPKVARARELSDSELAEEILATKRELFNLRMQQATRRLEKPHLFKHLRHKLAQLMTVEGERLRALEISAEPETSEPLEISEPTETSEPTTPEPTEE